jgi:hypothetical protein
MPVIILLYLERLNDFEVYLSDFRLSEVKLFNNRAVFKNFAFAKAIILLIHCHR